MARWHAEDFFDVILSGLSSDTSLATAARFISEVDDPRFKTVLAERFESPEAVAWAEAMLARCDVVETRLVLARLQRHLSSTARKR